MRIWIIWLHISPRKMRYYCRAVVWHYIFSLSVGFFGEIAFFQGTLNEYTCACVIELSKHFVKWYCFKETKSPYVTNMLNITIIRTLLCSLSYPASNRQAIFCPGSAIINGVIIYIPYILQLRIRYPVIMVLVRKNLFDQTSVG